MMSRQLLFFPIAVVVLAFVSFLCGGCCAAWQWWSAAAATIAFGFWRRTVREGVRSGACFLAWLVVFWVGSGVFAGASWWDEVVYHYPAVRMLAGGWNPVKDCTPEAAMAATGLLPGECRIDHIVYMPKIVWTFAAAAWFFTGDVFNPLSPVLWFLFPAVVARIWRSMSAVNLFWKILAIPALYCIVPNSAYAVDSVVALSAIGLLLCFEEIVSRRGLDSLSLVAYSFWMMGAKTPGLIHGGLFWGIFLAFVIWKRREDVSRISFVMAFVAIMLAIVNSTPYLTSIWNYGHPFYPKYSFDEKRFPLRDLTEDFLTERNDDAASMGYCGLYANAFISPKLTRAWYAWRLDEPDFKPYSRNYCHYPNDPPGFDGSSPTQRGMRMLFWLSLAFLFFAPAKSWRMPALCVLLCMGAAPPQMLGYIRYIPWWLSPAILAFVAFSRMERRLPRYVLMLFVFAFICMVGPHTLPNRLVYAATLVERRLCLAELFESPGAAPLAIRPNIRYGSGHLKLLFRHARHMAKPEILPYSIEHRAITKQEGLEIAGHLFVIDDIDEMRRHAFRYPEGTFHSMMYLLRVYFRMIPCAAVKRIGSLFDDRMTGEDK